MWHRFWHSFWHLFRHSMKHLFPHSFWHSFRHLFWHSIWNLTFYLTFYLASILTFFLAFYLEAIPTFCLAFYLACVRVQACPAASRAGDMARVQACTAVSRARDSVPGVPSYIRSSLNGSERQGWHDMRRRWQQQEVGARGRGEEEGGVAPLLKSETLTWQVGKNKSHQITIQGDPKPKLFWVWYLTWSDVVMTSTCEYGPTTPTCIHLSGRDSSLYHTVPMSIGDMFYRFVMLFVDCIFVFAVHTFCFWSFKSIFAYVCPACLFIALHLAANNDLNISPSFPIIDSFRHCLWLQSQRKRPTPERRRVWTHRLGSATRRLDLLILRGSNNEDYSLEIPPKRWISDYRNV